MTSIIKQLLLSLILATAVYAQNVQSLTCDKGQAPGALPGPPLDAGATSTCTVTLDTTPTSPVTFAVTLTGGLAGPSSLVFATGNGSVTVGTKTWTFTMSVKTMTFVVTNPLPVQGAL